MRVEFLLVFISMLAPTQGERPPFSRICPLPTCSQCVSRDDIIRPGIGLDLTISYGTSAVRRHDGQVEDLAVIQGDVDYQDVIFRLSQLSTKRPSPIKYDSIWDELSDVRKRYARRLNKLLGRPATPDVGTIASLIMQLRAATEEKLGKKISTVMVTAPNLPGLSAEDLKDAIEYAGLQSLMPSFPSRVFEPSAAFAAMGRGLCKSYTNVDACAEEEWYMPPEHVFAVEFSRRALSLTSASMTKAFAYTEGERRLAWDLGLDALPTTATDQQAAYWARVQAEIQQSASDALVKGRPITQLQLLGDSAEHPTLLRVLKDALHAVQPHLGASLVEEATVHPSPLFLAARGAAEFAKRLQEAPRGCVESEHCQEVRKNIQHKLRGHVDFKPEEL